MKNINEIKAVTATQEYERKFWDAIRFKLDATEDIRDAMEDAAGAYYVPSSGASDFGSVISHESVICPLATGLKRFGGGATIWAADSDDYAEFVPEGGLVPGFDAENDFTKFRVSSHKIAGLIKLSSEFVADVGFDIRGYVTGRIGKSFARTEDRAFVNGTGTGEPFGLLHETEGAEIGVSTEGLTYDDIVDLFFSVKPEYRKSAVWMMSDRTAQVLRKLKDDAGSYLWHDSTDTILGKPVRICNEMPDIAAGAKSVFFGDFGFYWIIDRSPVSLKPLKERFAMNDQVGYIGYEMLDARLVRRDAVKCLAIGSV